MHKNQQKTCFVSRQLGIGPETTSNHFKQEDRHQIKCENTKSCIAKTLKHVHSAPLCLNGPLGAPPLLEDPKRLPSKLPKQPKAKAEEPEVVAEDWKMTNVWVKTFDIFYELLSRCVSICFDIC